MDKSLAFILGIFPLFFASFFGIMVFLIGQNILVIGVHSLTGDAFFITFCFAFPLGMWAMIIVEKLEKLR